MTEQVPHDFSYFHQAALRENKLFDHSFLREFLPPRFKFTSIILHTDSTRKYGFLCDTSDKRHAKVEELEHCVKMKEKTDGYPGAKVPNGTLGVFVASDMFRLPSTKCFNLNRGVFVPKEKELEEDGVFYKKSATDGKTTVVVWKANGKFFVAGYFTRLEYEEETHIKRYPLTDIYSCIHSSVCSRNDSIQLASVNANKEIDVHEEADADYMVPMYRPSDCESCLLRIERVVRERMFLHPLAFNVNSNPSIFYRPNNDFYFPNNSPFPKENVICNTVCCQAETDYFFFKRSEDELCIHSYNWNMNEWKKEMPLKMFNEMLQTIRKKGVMTKFCELWKSQDGVVRGMGDRALDCSTHTPLHESIPDEASSSDHEELAADEEEEHHNLEETALEVQKQLNRCLQLLNGMMEDTDEEGDEQMTVGEPEAAPGWDLTVQPQASDDLPHPASIAQLLFQCMHRH